MKVLVMGGTGFVGDHVVRHLAVNGFEVRVASRSPPRRLPTATAFVPADVTDPASIVAAMDGVDAVVHLTAIIVERASQTFERVNHQGTRNLIDAVQARGVERLVHLSALGAGPDERFPYLRSKWLAEEAVRASDLTWTILRPSALHGEGAGFFRPIVWTLRWAPVYPMVARGETRFQPLWIEDLARCVAASLRGEAARATLDLGGPEVMTFSDIVRLVMETLGKRRRVVPVPVWAARPFALVQEVRKDPLVTNQQLDMVVLDNTCALDSVERAFGFRPVRMADTDLRWLARL